MQRLLLFSICSLFYFIMYGQFDAPHIIQPPIDKPDGIQFVDIEGDGDLDLLAFTTSTTPTLDSEIILWKNLSDGQYATPTILYQQDTRISSVICTDINSDGRQDILVTSSGNQTLFWLENKGNSKFDEAQIITENASAYYSLQPMDIENDGDIDFLTVASFNITKFLAYQNNGQGSFSLSSPILELNTGLDFYRVADFNEDGLLDILVYRNYDKLAWYSNKGNGSFEAPVVILNDPSIRINNLITLDIDNDEDEDIVALSNTGNFLYTNSGNGYFEEPKTIGENIHSFGVLKKIDVNQDGFLDIVSYSYYNNEVFYFKNEGEGAFSEGQEIFNVSGGVRQIASIDMDNDGDLDFLCLGSNDYDFVLSWRINDGNENFEEKRPFYFYFAGIHDVENADVDGDGDVDIVATSETSQIFWFANNGSGQYSEARIAVEYYSHNSNIELIDLDEDGDMDIVTENASWFKNDGLGNFEEKIDLIHGSNASLVDMDGDGDLDILANTNYVGFRIVWYENMGNLEFGAKQVIEMESLTLIDYKAADLDMDGDIDLVVAKKGDTGTGRDKIIIYENDGNFHFSKQEFSEFAYKVNKIDCADVEKDGDMDLIFATPNNTLLVYKNDGQANFDKKAYTLSEYGNIELADLNGDNYLDIIGMGSFYDKIVVRMNDGNGIFDTHWETAISANAVSVADCNRDGYPEIVAGSKKEDKIYIFRNISDRSIYTYSFIDLNENGLYEKNEPPLLNHSLQVAPMATVSIGQANNGYDIYHLGIGEYELKASESSLWETTIPNLTYHLEVKPKDNQFNTFYFGFKPKRILNQVETHLTLSPFRCSTEKYIWLEYSNTGTTTASGKIYFEYDELLEIVETNPFFDFQHDNILEWSFKDLLPSDSKKIKIKVLSPNAEHTGEVIEAQTKIEILDEAGNTLSIDENSENSIVRCSYDPNDKLVAARHSNLAESGEVWIQDTLLYTIRFQNTGNDVAYNVLIRDQLDDNLDWSSLHLLAASHSVRNVLTEQGELQFFFDDIYLADSTNNEPESHGFVKYGIRPKANLHEGLFIHNTASIFFDFNPPILTNTVETQITHNFITNIKTLNSDHSMRVFPNPFSGYTTIEVNGLSQENHQLEVMDILGRKVRELKIEGGKVRLEREELTSGLYLIQVLQEENGKILGSRKVLVE